MFKYILFEDEQSLPHLRIFDFLSESHADVKNSAPPGWHVVGAGEFHCESMSLIRGSVTLNMAHTKEGCIDDTKLANQLYNAA
jgi:hypothetical protein